MVTEISKEILHERELIENARQEALEWERLASEKGDEPATEQERLFAENLEALLRQRQIEPAEYEVINRLAEFGPGTIQAMLLCRCRPQRRSRYRLAQILGVLPEHLWPWPKK